MGVGKGGTGELPGINMQSMGDSSGSAFLGMQQGMPRVLRGVNAQPSD